MGKKSRRTIKGTSKDDVLTGTQKNDRIKGHAGDDIIDSGAGMDKVWGMKGKDRLKYSVVLLLKDAIAARNLFYTFEHLSIFRILNNKS